MSNFKFNAKKKWEEEQKKLHSRIGKQHFKFIEDEKQFTKSCARCGSDQDLQRHHKYPRRFFGRQDNHKTVILCKTCHIDIEVLIPKHVKLPEEWYDTFTLFFIDTKRK